MKKSIITAVLFIVTIFCGYSQNLDLIIQDFTRLFDGFGHEIAPHMVQNELSGYGMGAADFSDDKTFFISWSLGANLSDGIFSFVDEENTNFDVLNMHYFMESTISSLPGFIRDGYETAQTFYPYPNLRLATGFNFIDDTEVILLFSIWPAVVTDLIADAASVSGLELSSLNAGLRVRKPLVKDSGGFPAISLGLGYTFANFHLGYVIPEFTQDLSGDSLIISGDMYLDTLMNTGGIDLVISKEFGFFVPFFKAAAYYNWTIYHGGMSNFLARIEDSGGNPIAETTEGPDSRVEIMESAFILGGGFELRMGSFVLVPYSTLNLSTLSFTANLEMRVDF